MSDDEKESHANLQESRMIWRWVSILLICFFVLLIVIAIKAGNLDQIELIEVMEVNNFNLPDNMLAIGIKFREIQTGKEYQKSFLIKGEENHLIKKGSKYALVHKSCDNKQLKNIGVKHELLKIYELK
ncbi:MAG: hypothetical protein NT170_02340 [Candidatus Moranbacteria bacterium]|nr:hypothetical protein [Candidatus Moranbacteria bacterium]